jgi:hypothetical protein
MKSLFASNRTDNLNQRSDDMASDHTNTQATEKAKQLRKATQPNREYDNREAVTAYLDSLDHPLKPVLAAIRRTILAADGAITEGIKWKSPSFYCHGWFATANVRAKDSVQIVLHHGARVRDDSTLRQTLDDSAHLLAWASPDRALVTFTSVADFQHKQEAFHKIIQQWAAYQRQLANSGSR